MAETAPILVPIELLDRMSGQMATISSHLEGEARKAGQGIARGVAIGTMAIDAAKMAYRSLSGFVMSGVRDAMEAERANLALGDSQARLVPYLEDLADRLNTSDDAMKRGAATMLKTGKVTDGFVEHVMKGLPAFEALGIGVEQGSDAIAMALMGATRGMKQFGIEIAEGASTKEVIAAITAKMKEMEGQADKLAASSTGKIRGMAEAWGEVKEAMGTKFLTAITTSEDGIKSMQVSLENLGTAGGKSVGLLITGLDSFIKKVGEAGTVLGEAVYKNPAPEKNPFNIMQTVRDVGAESERRAREESESDGWTTDSKGHRMHNVLGNKPIRQEGSITDAFAANSEEADREFMELYDEAARAADENYQTEKSRQEELMAEKKAALEEEYKLMAKNAEDRAALARKEMDERAALQKKIDDAAIAAAAKVIADMQAALGAAPTTTGGAKSAERESRRANEDLISAGKAETSAAEYQAKGDTEGYEKEMKRADRLRRQSERHAARANPALSAYNASLGGSGDPEMDNLRSMGLLDEGGGSGGKETKIDTSKAEKEIKEGKEKVVAAISDLAGYFKANFKELSDKVDDLAGHL